MKGKNAKKQATSKVSEAISGGTEGGSTVVANKKHHKKPKKQYL
ncbi:hypothetical protein lbkm_0472 [Lachnospiraceae bacterium KM106-2]|nr:hypothetical protein lbkm_0472 [Lachnospiraceae bacterium KM106-2]